MKFIESLELREWVKEKLKKKLFQNAHALAVQTGCEVLVKLHDTTDITGCQYYATNNLRKIYNTSKLRQHGETAVSGETGLPLSDKCIQYEDEPTIDGQDCGVPEDDSGGGEGGQNNEEMNDDFVEESEMPDISAFPMQLIASGQTGYSGTETQTTQSDTTDIDITHVTNQSNLVAMGTQVKQEPVYEQQHQQDFNQQGMMGNMPPQQVEQQQHQQYASYPISPKPYQCSICRKAFKSVHVLQKHTLTFHQPGGMSSTTTLSRGRGRGRGSRGNKTRGRGRGISSILSRPTLVQQPFQPPQPPTVKTEDGQNRFTCIMCNQQFDESSQLNEHMSQCPMAPGSSSQGALQQQDPSANQFAQGTPIAPGMAGAQESAAFSGGGEFPQNPPVTTSSGNWGLEGTPRDAGTADYFGHQTPGSSTFGSPGQSPGQTPRSTSSGSSRKRKSTKTGSGILGQNMILSRRSIMAAILQTAGPVSTCQALRWNWKFLSSATVQQFQAAAMELETANLGNLITLPSQKGRGVCVFVKKPPEGAEQQLLLVPDLCSVDMYAARYDRPSSKSITWNIRSQLVNMGLVSQKQFM